MSRQRQKPNLNAAAVAMLGVLDRADGPLTEAELCDELGISTAYLMVLIERCPSPEELQVTVKDSQTALEVVGDE